MTKLLKKISEESLKYFLDYFSNQILSNHPTVNHYLTIVQNTTGINKRYPVYLFVSFIFTYLVSLVF